MPEFNPTVRAQRGCQGVTVGWWGGGVEHKRSTQNGRVLAQSHICRSHLIITLRASCCQSPEGDGESILAGRPGNPPFKEQRGVNVATFSLLSSLGFPSSQSSARGMHLPTRPFPRLNCGPCESVSNCSTASAGREVAGKRADCFSMEDSKEDEKLRTWQGGPAPPCCCCSCCPSCTGVPAVRPRVPAPAAANPTFCSCG